jgi:uncharacterized RDD family membrane protein YckC
MAVGGMVPATTLVRLVAYFLDSLLIALPSILIVIILASATQMFRDVDFSSPDSTRVFSERFAGIGGVLGTILSFIYYVPLWSSAGQGTLGMRFLRLRLGNAADGARLPLNQAVRRWVAFGAPLGLLGLLPGAGAQAGSLQSLWTLVLLISVIANPVKQGIHDTFAKTAVLMPAAGPGGRLAAGCLILIVAIALPVLLAFLFAVYIAMLMGAPYYNP